MLEQGEPEREPDQGAQQGTRELDDASHVTDECVK
jgi:hypothetical protein